MIDSDKLLTDLVQMNTAGENEAEMANYLKALFDEYGIKNQIVNYTETRASIIAEIGNGNGPVLAFEGHEDTVALGDRDKWNVDPLSAQIVDGKMIGRGTTDMKAGLAAAVVAMIKLRDADLNGTFKLYATVGEESGETGAEQIVEKGLANNIDALLIGEPSSADNQVIKMVMNKGGLPGFYIKADLAELAANNNTNQQHFIISAHKGAISYTVTSQGKAAHSSMPELGVNAIDGLVEFIEKQKAYFAKIQEIENPVLGRAMPAISQISGGEQPNTVPGKASFTGFIRTIPEIKHEQVLADLNAMAEEVNAHSKAVLTVQQNFENRPVESSETSKLSQITKAVSEQVLDQTVPYIGVSGGTDASQFVKANPNLDVQIIGPGNITAHQVNEYVEMDSYHQFVDIYEQIITKYFE